jgi:uncharacterized protein
MIFVDTSVWFAAHVVEDLNYIRADELLTNPANRLVTTDYVIDELLTLLLMRGHRAVAQMLGPLLFSENMAEIVWVNSADVAAAWHLFDTYTDKTWSFTDCVSYSVMKRLGIQDAFALDDDFRQFGFVNVRP